VNPPSSLGSNTTLSFMDASFNICAKHNKLVRDEAMKGWNTQFLPLQPLR
jgi:hypothetical protein